MNFNEALSESINYKEDEELDTESVKSNKIKEYFNKIKDKNKLKEIDKTIKRKGLSGKNAVAYKLAILHKLGAVQ